MLHFSRKSLRLRKTESGGEFSGNVIAAAGLVCPHQILRMALVGVAAPALLGACRLDTSRGTFNLSADVGREIAASLEFTNPVDVNFDVASAVQGGHVDPPAADGNLVLGESASGASGQTVSGPVQLPRHEAAPISLVPFGQAPNRAQPSSWVPRRARDNGGFPTYARGAFGGGVHCEPGWLAAA